MTNELTILPITERSAQAARDREVWTLEDHLRMMAHIREIEASWAKLVFVAGKLHEPSRKENAA